MRIHDSNGVVRQINGKEVLMLLGILDLLNGPVGMLVLIEPFGDGFD